MAGRALASSSRILVGNARSDIMGTRDYCAPIIGFKEFVDCKKNDTALNKADDMGSVLLPFLSLLPGSQAEASRVAAGKIGGGVEATGGGYLGDAHGGLEQQVFCPFQTQVHIKSVGRGPKVGLEQSLHLTGGQADFLTDFCEVQHLLGVIL